MNFKRLVGIFFSPKLRAEARKYKLSYGERHVQSAPEKETKASQETSCEFTLSRAAPMNIQKTPGIISAWGGHRHFVLVNVRMASGVTGAQMSALSVASASRM